MRAFVSSFVAAVVLLGGCTRNGDDVIEGTPQTEYSALGRDPDWALRLDRTRVSYTGDGGATHITVERPIATATPAGQRYATSRIVVDIVPGACGDAVGGSGFDDAVAVTVAGRTVRGCGGNRAMESGF